MARLFCSENISNFQERFIYANDTGNDGGRGNLVGIAGKD
jgi:hypothetical protein